MQSIQNVAHLQYICAYATEKHFSIVQLRLALCFFYDGAVVINPQGCLDYYTTVLSCGYIQYSTAQIDLIFFYIHLNFENSWPKK